MSKEELREDPVLERLQTGLDFLEHNSRWIGIGVAAVVVIIIAGVMMNRAHQRSEVDAAQILSIGQGLYLQGQHQEATTRLQELLDNYGGTLAADQAHIYLGDAHLAAGQAEEALAAYEEAADAVGSDMLRAAADRGQGAALEALGRAADASSAYERAAAIATHFQEDDLLNAGRCALQALNASRARTLLVRAQDLAGSEDQPRITFYLAQAEAILGTE